MNSSPWMWQVCKSIKYKVFIGCCTGTFKFATLLQKIRSTGKSERYDMGFNASTINEGHEAQFCLPIQHLCILHIHVLCVRKTYVKLLDYFKLSLVSQPKYRQDLILILHLHLYASSWNQVNIHLVRYS